MKTAHKIRMNPTSEQVEYLKRACGTRRFIYNWGRDQWEKQYQAYQLEQATVPQEQRVLTPPNAFALKKQFHQIREQDYPWTYQVTKCVVEGASLLKKATFQLSFMRKAPVPSRRRARSHSSLCFS